MTKESNALKYMFGLAYYELMKDGYLCMRM